MRFLLILMYKVLSGEKGMTSKLSSKKGKQATYLAGYFALLAFSISGLVLQGGIWVLAGAVCFFGVVAACFLLRSIDRHVKNLKYGALTRDGYKAKDFEES